MPNEAANTASGLSWAFWDTQPGETKLTDANGDGILAFNKNGGVPGFLANVVIVPSYGLGCSVQTSLAYSDGPGADLDEICWDILSDLVKP